MDPDLLVPLVAIVSIFVVLPGLLLHHMTQWRNSKSLSADDERMLEDIWRSARAMERRIETLERLVEPEGGPDDAAAQDQPSPSGAKN